MNPLQIALLKTIGSFGCLLLITFGLVVAVIWSQGLIVIIIGIVALGILGYAAFLEEYEKEKIKQSQFF